MKKTMIPGTSDRPWFPGALVLVLHRYDWEPLAVQHREVPYLYHMHLKPFAKPGPTERNTLNEKIVRTYLIKAVCVRVCAQLLSPSRVQPFATLWTHQAALSIGILQARIMEWFATPFSKGSSQPRDQTQVSCTGRYNGSKLHCPGPDSVWRW